MVGESAYNPTTIISQSKKNLSLVLDKQGRKIMNTKYYIDMTMRAEDRRKAVANGLRKAMKTGDEIRFNRECSMWESGDNLVLCAYGYKPQKVNIEGMTFEDIVDEILDTFHF